MVFSTLILFLPVSGCLFWLLFNSLAARRTSTFWIMSFLLLDLFLYFITDSCYADPTTRPEVLVHTSILAQFTAPCIIPLILMYFRKLANRVSFKPHAYAWFIAPVILLTAAIALTDVCGKPEVAIFLDNLYSNGPDSAEPFKGTLLGAYYFWTAVGFRVVLGIEFIVGVIYMLRYVIQEKVRFRHLFRFLRRGERISIRELQLFNLIIPALLIVVKISFLRSFLGEHLWLALLLAIVITVSMFIFAYCALAGECNQVSLVQLQHILVYNYNSKIKGLVTEELMEELMEDAEQEALQRLQGKIGENLHLDTMAPRELAQVKEKIFQTMAGNWDDSLLTRFQSLILNDQLFLQPSLSLGDIAEKLHTNKTYVSKMVNNTYNMSFPELLSILRIDYAEQYILNHPDARQTEIAQACGFLSASSFNNMFKKVTGVTPKMWLATNEGK